MNMNRLREMNPLCLIQEDPARSGLAATVYLDGGCLPDAACVMRADGYHLEDVCALHVREGFLVSYFFTHWQIPGRIALRALTSNEEPGLPSIADIYEGADWHEREVNDFYGIHFEGHPNPIRLLLPSDMNEYPLRKEESARAPLRTLFPCTEEAVILKKPEWTLFDPDPEKADQTPAAPVTGGAKSEGSAG